MKEIKFKPEFGNNHHIYIVTQIGKLNKMHNEFTVKMKEAKGAEKLKKDIAIMEKKIDYLIEKENNK